MSRYQGLRAAVYARYSTDMQNPKSVDDQIHECRQWAAREGVTVTGVYSDREKTSMTLFGREGLSRLMKDAETGRFDLVVAEHTDRVSRQPADAWGLKLTLDFLKVRMVTVNQGEIDDAQIGLHSLLGKLQMKELANKVRRGMKGKVRDGKLCCRPAYGYRTVENRPGEREIVPEQAAVIRRIFDWYVDGVPVRAILQRLKDEGVPPPTAKGWRIEGLSGGRSATGHKGILNNRLYIGQIVFGETVGIQNPLTGRTVRRAVDEPEVVPAEHLRIVDDDTWAKARAIMAGHVRIPGRPRAEWRKSDGLLRGKLRCGVCGGLMILVTTSGRDSRGRVRCAAAHSRNACDHRQTYDLPRLQATVTDALETQLGDEARLQARVDYFLDCYRDTFQRQQRAARRAADQTAKRLADIAAARVRLIGLVEIGETGVEAAAARLKELAIEEAALKERQRIAEAKINVVSLHPSALRQYTESVRLLTTEMKKGGALPQAVRHAFATAVDSVTVLPTGRREPYRIEIRGPLARMIGFDIFPEVRADEKLLLDQGRGVRDNGAKGRPSSALSSKRGPSESAADRCALAALSSKSVSLGIWIERRAA